MSDDFDISKALAEVRRSLKEQVDFCLVARIEELIGRVPSRDEMAEHIKWLVRTRTLESHYFWKGRLILVVTPPKQPNGKYILRTT